jgi:hypothetical protein
MRCFTAWPVRLPDLMRSRGPIALLAVAAFAVAGCGSSESHAGGGGGQSVQGLILPKETSDLNVKPVIAPNETLVFVIDLKKVTKAK